MGTVKRVAEEVERGLREVHPGLRKAVVKKLALAVGAMLEGQTPNPVELADLLRLATERQDMREQWLRRLLKNPLLNSEAVMAPWAGQELAQAARPSGAAESGSDRAGGSDGGVNGVRASRGPVAAVGPRKQGRPISGLRLSGACWKAAVLDYGARWAIEPTFSDFRGSTALWIKPGTDQKPGFLLFEQSIVMAY